jgi:hypothetical protein
MDAFADAAARAAGQATPSAPAPAELVVRQPPDAEGALPVVVDPATGEVYHDPAELSTDRLADVAYRCHQHEVNAKLWRRAAEDELRARLERDGRREATIGGYQLEVRSGRSRQWDADDLEGAVQGLVDGGVLQAGEVADLIVREAKVNGTLAKRLLDTLTGPAHDVVASCFTWVQRQRPTVTVERVPEQLPPGQ